MARTITATWACEAPDCAASATTVGADELPEGWRRDYRGHVLCDDRACIAHRKAVGVWLDARENEAARVRRELEAAIPAQVAEAAVAWEDEHPRPVRS